MTPTPSAVRVRRRGAGVLVVAVLVGAAALPVVVPEWVGLDTVRLFAELVSARPLVAVALLVLGAVLASSGRTRPAGATLALVGLLAAAMVVPRALPPLGATPPPAHPLTVLALNVHDGGAEVGPLGDLIAAERPDLVVLPEAGDRYRRLLAPRTEPLGYRAFSSTPVGVRDMEGVVVLTAPGLGELTASVPPIRTTFRWLEVRGGGLGAVRVVAVHPAAPVPNLIRRWAADLGALRAWCGPDAGPTVVVGDLNATLDHRVLRDATAGCVDVAARRGSGLVATWPASWPRWLGVQIDHVMSSPGIRAVDFRVLDIPGTDHRGILARLDLPAP